MNSNSTFQESLIVSYLGRALKQSVIFKFSILQLIKNFNFNFKIRHDCHDSPFIELSRKRKRKTVHFFLNNVSHTYSVKSVGGRVPNSSKSVTTNNMQVAVKSLNYFYELNKKNKLILKEVINLLSFKFSTQFIKTSENSDQSFLTSGDITHSILLYVNFHSSYFPAANIIKFVKQCTERETFQECL